MESFSNMMTRNRVWYRKAKNLPRHDFRGRNRTEARKTNDITSVQYLYAYGIISAQHRSASEALEGATEHVIRDTFDVHGCYLRAFLIVIDVGNVNRAVCANCT